MISSPAQLAVLSQDGRYRYFLSRNLNFEGPIVVFIGLNPSTADATHDDPTIRRCMSFAKQWDARELWMVNLFGYRSTSPNVLKQVQDPVGPDNDQWLNTAVEKADIVVASWGNHSTLMGRGETIKARHSGKLHALRVTRLGMPNHPLYIPSNETLKRFS